MSIQNNVLSTAKTSFERWSKIKNDVDSPYRMLIANQIAETSKIGFYEIWIEIFKDEQTILDEIERVWYG